MKNLDEKEIKIIIDKYGTYSEWVINNYIKITKEFDKKSNKENEIEAEKPI